MKPDPNLTSKKTSLAILVGVTSKFQEEDRSQEFLEELAFLAETYGVETKKWFTQKLEKPDKSTFIGKGKVEEIKTFAKANDVFFEVRFGSGFIFYLAFTELST